MQETFHNIVHNNPELLGDLVLSLELEYGRQEIAALVNDNIEVYDGIYGTFEEGMTEAQQEALVMRYMDEVFADVYGDIRRGKHRTTAVQKIMRDQTDAVQRAAQNRKGTGQGKAGYGRYGGAKGLPIDGRSALYHPTQQNKNFVALALDLRRDLWYNMVTRAYRCCWFVV